MRILKCDVCKKIINGDPVRAEVGFRSQAELCHKCGLPVLKLLKKYKFLKEEKSKLYA